MKVPGKKCSRYVTRHWKERRARANERLFEFLFDFYAGNEALAKKAFAQINGRGLGELEMFTICDLIEEWWAKEKPKRAKQNWEKALKKIEQQKDAALLVVIDSYIEKHHKDNEALRFR
jgi:hypothetical protein